MATINFAVHFDTDSDKTYLKVFCKGNLVFAEVDKPMSQEEKMKVTELLAVICQMFGRLDEEILTEYLNSIL